MAVHLPESMRGDRPFFSFLLLLVHPARCPDPPPYPPSHHRILAPPPTPTLRFAGCARPQIVVILPLVINGLLPLWDYFSMAGLLPYVSLPTWLLSSTSANSALLNLRLLRILKFQRILTDKDTYMKFELALGMRMSDVRPYQLQLARVAVSIFTLVSVSTGLIYAAEHEVNPQIPDYFTALYFGLTTLTTVGFGDISPVTSQGRLVVCATILAGVAIVPAQAASLAEAYLDFQKERIEGQQQQRLLLRRPAPLTASSSSSSSVAATTATSSASSSAEIGTTGTGGDGAGGGRCCGECGASHQRVDASFCWSCGVKLPEW